MQGEEEGTNRRARMCGRIRPGGTKAISRPNPNTATTFLSENDKKDGTNGGVERGDDKNQPTVVTNFFPTAAADDDREFRVGG